MNKKREKNYQAAPVKMVATPNVNLGATAGYTYMRPNVANGGTLPATGTLSGCPDIWPANTTPISNYQTALATQQSYDSDSPSAITLYTDNYIYVRGYNGGSANDTETVTLFYVPSAMIQYPSNWQGNVIPTDGNAPNATIVNLPPGQIGVAPATFLWHNVPQPPGGSDHYCLIAWFNDANNTNPFPDVSSSLDISNLITNNFRWGWHNISLMSPAPGFRFSFSTGLNIALNGTTGYYSIVLTPVGYVGWQVGFTSSEVDSKGNVFTLAPTTITQDNMGISVQNIYLEAGYNSLITISLYNPNNLAPVPGAKVGCEADYKTSTAEEFQFALENSLINWRLTQAHNAASNVEMPVHGYVQLGAVTGKMPS